MGNILIIGASSDFGRALLSSLNHPDSSVIAHFNSRRKHLDEIASRFKGKLSLVGADLDVEADTRRLLDQLSAEPIDKIVFLPAPRVTAARFHALPWEQFETQLNVQLRALVLILQRFIPRMVKQKHGKVVTMSTSFTVGVPPSFMAHYVSAKYALIGLTKALAAEYSSKQIQINSISPSMTETGYLDDIDERVVQANATNHPMKRNAIPNDIIPLIRFLLSPESDYLTGLNIPVTGGQVF